MIKNIKICYCDIDNSYLNELFGPHESLIKKLTGQKRRPLIAIKFDGSETIVIPEKSYLLYMEKSYHGDDKKKFGKYNFNFVCENDKYLDVGAYFYVPEKFIKIPSKYSFPFENDKIEEISSRINTLERIMKRFSKRMELSLTFALAHPYIEKSKQLCEEYNLSKTAK